MSAIGAIYGTTWYGQKGTLTHIGDKVQCHVCGHAFHHLGNHVWLRHGLTPEAYKDEFGLNRSTGLISRKLAEKRIIQCTLQSPENRRKAHEAAAVMTRGKRTTKPSLEERLKDGYHERQQRFIDAGKASLQQRLADGTWTQPQNPNSREDARKGAQKWVEMRRDPQTNARWRQKLAAAKLQPVQRICTHCGSVFVTGRYNGKRATCGKACLKARKQTLVRRMHTPEAAAKISAKAAKRQIIRDEAGRIKTWVTSA